MIAIPQADGEFVTKGRIYKVIKLECTGRSKIAFRLYINSGHLAFCLDKGCAHIGGGDWFLTSAPIEPDPKNRRPNNLRRRK